MANCILTRRLRDAILHTERPTVDVRSLTKVASRKFPRIVPGVDGSQRHIFPDEKSYSDNEPPFEIDDVILSGSWSEGLFLYVDLSPPDLDYMLVLKNIKFSEEDQRTGNLLLRPDTPYVYAYITDEKCMITWNEFLVDGEGSSGKRLSSLKLKEKLCENHKKLLASLEDYSLNDIDDGAAMNINKIDEVDPYPPPSMSTSGLTVIANAPGLKRDLNKVFRQLWTFTSWDIVLAISCDGWPFCAKEWLTRERSWPPDDLVEKISKAGFHIVPKSSTDGDFRLSFSRAETMLITNMGEIQYKLLRSFKAVVKHHQHKLHDWSPNIKEIITTYHLKTIGFWYFEEVSFTEETVVTHLISLLQKLAESLRRQELWMYFMPKVNLFQNVKNVEESIRIAWTIDLLSENFSLLLSAVKDTIDTGLDLVVTTNFWEEFEASAAKQAHKTKNLS